MCADFVPLNEYQEFTDDEMLDRSQDFYNSVRSRRTVRDYSNRRVSREVIDRCLMSAGTAPSGANPVKFVTISTRMRCSPSVVSRLTGRIVSPVPGCTTSRLVLAAIPESTITSPDRMAKRVAG